MPPSLNTPRWLRNWKYLMVNFLEHLYAVQTMVLNYVATSMRPKIKDYILDSYFPPQTAVTMLKTVTAAMVQKNSTAVYQNDPNTCGHPSGLRTYGAAGYKVHICDLCGNRWRESKDKDKSLILCAPKASPTAKTPLGLKTGDPYFPKKPQGAMALAEGLRASSSEPWGSSSAGARRSQSRSLSVQTSKAKAKPSVRLTAQALAARQVAEMDDVSMGSWDLQEHPQQQPAPSISYAPSIRSSRVMPGRRPLAKMEPQQEELTLGTSGEHVWMARAAHYNMDEENYEEEPEEEEIENEYYDEEEELHQPLDG